MVTSHGFVPPRLAVLNEKWARIYMCIPEEQDEKQLDGIYTIFSNDCRVLGRAERLISAMPNIRDPRDGCKCTHVFPFSDLPAFESALRARRIIAHSQTLCKAV